MPLAKTIKPGTEYQRRNPEDSVRYQVLQEHLETFLVRGESDHVLPKVAISHWVLTVPHRILFFFWDESNGS